MLTAPFTYPTSTEQHLQEPCPANLPLAPPPPLNLPQPPFLAPPVVVLCPEVEVGLGGVELDGQVVQRVAVQRAGHRARADA